MKVNPIPLAAIALFAAAPAFAGPHIVADIPPVHSLAAAVMEGIGKPELILPPGASPHDYAMRPSEAARLEAAEVVFWVGEGLTPWLETALDALATDAVKVELMDAPGLRQLPFREGATFEAHDHGDEDHAATEKAAGHDHDHDHDHDHGHAKKAEEAHADHAHGDHGHEGHDHGAFDPHVWLDPRNAAAMGDAMAEALAAADPANADAYRANAARLRADLAALETEISAAVAPARGKPFIVFHDAYHHFEARFEVEAAGAISLSDASAPGPARLDELRRLVRDLSVVCVFAEPQFDPKLAALVVEGTEAEVAILDPLGVEIEPGAALYPALIRGVGAALLGCLDRAS